MFIEPARRCEAPSVGPCTLGHLIPPRSDPPESTVLDSIDIALLTLTEGVALQAEGTWHRLGSINIFSPL